MVKLKKIKRGTTASRQKRPKFAWLKPRTRAAFKWLQARPVPSAIATALLFVIFVQFVAYLQTSLMPANYTLGSAAALLPESNDAIAKKIVFDKASQTYALNTAEAAASSSLINGQHAKVTVPKNASKGLLVSDPISKVDFKLTPKFGLRDGRQDGDRIVYPLKNGLGWAVYTIQTAGVKEDIVLDRAAGDDMTFEYHLGLGDGLSARLESDGSVGIYGNSLFSGDISTGTEKDAELLRKARQNATKNQLIFRIPKPATIETGNPVSSLKTNYELSGDTLKVNVTGLRAGHYPLSIDPSIYVASAEQFMLGNNETNITYDVDNSLIKKGRTTGARFDAWQTTANLPNAIWGGGAVASGGYLYSIGGASFSGQVFAGQGADTFKVPDDVSEITVKVWGAGGGGGSGGLNSAGGDGGGGGYVLATVPVTPGETLNMYVGGGGGAGPNNGAAGGAGGGGGYSSIYRGSTPLVIAAGGGGGGGGNRNSANYFGGAGGAGGGTTGVSGENVTGTSGGSGGTQSAGGAGGAGRCDGDPGSSLAGGAGGNYILVCNTGGGGDGGLTGGGAGGNWLSFFGYFSGGGGGGSGYFGGGGGGSSGTTSGGGGGGGGSSYTAGGLSAVSNIAGSGTSPGNAGDVFRGTAGNGGNGGAVNGAGSAGATGKIIISYSGTGEPATKTVNWAKFNTGTGTVDNANPGNGACSGWCSNSAYDLPAARANYSLVAYNGFLYAFGGTDNSVGLPRQKTVFIAKLGANGEPRKWHPTSTDTNNWVYWYQDTDLPAVLANASAVAYKDHMYLIGGLSTNATNGTSTVRVADILPNGKLGSWSTTTPLPSNLYGHTAQVYNDRIYVMGGAAAIGSTPTNAVYYAKVASDGSLGAWVSTSSFSGGRLSGGGSMAVVWGGYMYVSGGCGTVNSSGYCTNVLGDTQVASINADGSLDKWSTIENVSNQRMGFGMVAWRDNLYEVGGCSSQNTTTGDCLSGIQAGIDYGHVNQDGDASTVGQSVANGTAPCNGTVPTNCNLPGTLTVGNLLDTAIITNGYLYVIGGCTNGGCATVSRAVTYVAVAADGTLTKPATCPGGTTVGGMWCRSPNNVPAAVAGASPVVFNGTLYLVGGFTGSALNGNINRATLNSDGSIGAWTAQTMTSVGATSVSQAFAYARANPSSAATNPGNLYIFGGCTTSGSGATCTSYTDAVYKCNITSNGAVGGCTTSGQLQIGTVSGASGAGLGVMSGTVYANYVYLIGGSAPGANALATVRYAKFDNNNNVVTAGSGWVQSSQQLATARRNAAAFGYNGYIYVVGGYDSGAVNDIEFAKINVSDGSLDDSGFTTSSVTINQRWGLTVPVSNSYAYVIGGCTAGTAPSGCTAATNTLQTFQLYNNNSGTPAGYADSANMYSSNASRIGAGSAIVGGYLYVAGGCISATDCTDATKNVSYAPINDYGQVGAWSSAGDLPADRAWGKLLAAGGTLYYIGGQSDTASDDRSEVYYGTPSGSGNVSSWGTASNALPAARSNFGAAVWNDRLYVVGGEGTGTGCTGGVCNTVYVSPQLSSGGNITSSWSTASTPINVARSGASVVAYANNLYTFGGFDGSNYLSDSQYAKLNTSDGTAGSWTYSTSLPRPLAQSSAFGANGYIYLVGGRSSATTCDPVTLVAPVSANTTIASGNNPTGIGAWNEANQRFSDSRYGAAAVYGDGKAYVLGGGCGSTLTYSTTHRVQQTTLLSQPQVAEYSILIDTDSDVFPSHWLMNGLDNSIGARWNLTYRSMTNPGAATQCAPSGTMSNYGQATYFSSVSLGLPGVYTPKDASGNNTSCARYFKFSTSIDSSRSYGYPDDVSHGPTLTDLTLQFTADPSKRLMHGRTFTGGLQQPVDTPYYAY